MTAEADLPQVVLVDDSRVFARSCQRALAGQARLHVFDSPRSFWQALEGSPDLENVVLLITDLRFDDMDEDGLDLARRLRERRPAWRICLYTSAMLLPEDYNGAVDLVLDKTASFPPLAQLLGTGDQGQS